MPLLLQLPLHLHQYRCEGPQKSCPGCMRRVDKIQVSHQRRRMCWSERGGRRWARRLRTEMREWSWVGPQDWGEPRWLEYRARGWPHWQGAARRRAGEDASLFELPLYDVGRNCQLGKVDGTSTLEFEMPLGSYAYFGLATARRRAGSV